MYIGCRLLSAFIWILLTLVNLGLIVLTDNIKDLFGVELPVVKLTLIRIFLKKNLKKLVTLVVYDV